ncbi:MAG: transposase [Roseiarcus sp.]
MRPPLAPCPWRWIDEVYVVAGHAGNPVALEKKAQGPTQQIEGAPGRGTLEKEKPPILGMIQRGGQVVLKMLANVQQTRIKLIIEAGVAKGALIHTDECDTTPGSMLQRHARSLRGQVMTLIPAVPMG